MIQEHEIVLYQVEDTNICVNVVFKDETFWMTQKAMAELFDVNVPAISKHLSNIFEEGELFKEATVSKMEIVQMEGNRKVKREPEFYNLDAIIAVGYRVNSKKATRFRQWATKTLKEYITKGFVLNDDICDLLGADKISLTAPGNEGGVDFFARISFPQKAHFLFGTKGPIRIVGQCKKYANRDNVGHMKEFVTTMNNVYNKSYRAGEILPDWFKLEKGDIIGWHIANSGHQTGALDVAKNYGILVSDTKQLIEIICNSKIIRREKEPVKFLRSLMKEENYTY